jgi:mitochondrial intermediate peptidase
MNYPLYTRLSNALKHQQQQHHHHHQDIKDKKKGRGWSSISSTTNNSNKFNKGEDQEEETVLVGRMLKRDFERYGVHLTGPNADKMRNLTDTAAHLGMHIIHNITDPSALGHIPSLNNRNVLPADSGTLHSLLQYHEDEAVRKMAYLALHQLPSENIDLFTELSATRREIAAMNGHSSWSAYQLDDFSLAGQPGAVHAFLREISYNTRDLVEEEGNVLLQMKKKTQGSSSRGGQTMQLHPWDRLYYTNIAKKINNNHPSSFSRSLSSYFPLHICIQGLAKVVHSLTGVTLKQVPMLPQEGWASTTAATTSSSNDVILKYEATHPSEGYLGIVYLDLMPRPGKAPSPAHYTLRCRHKRNNQPAAVALVAGLSSSSSSTDSNNNNNNNNNYNNNYNSGLSLSDIETLFHEFGHALHSLVSSTQYQHLSGTRGPLDTVELPSQLFQLLAANPLVLESFFYNNNSSSTDSGNVGRRSLLAPPPAPPKGMIHAAVASRNMFPAMDLQQQCQLIALDQFVLHGDQDILSSSSSSYDDLMSSMMMTNPSSSSSSSSSSYYSYFPHIPTTRPFIRFGHGVGYGGIYHGYLYTECLAMEAMKRLQLVEQCTSTTSSSVGEGGDVLRSRLLAGGGAKEAREMVKSLLGDDVMIRSNNNNGNKMDTGGGGWYPKSDALISRLHSD